MTKVSKFQRGFTLVEAVIVIVVGGIMVAAIAMFMRWPFQSYLDAARHEQLSDTADTALRRIGRDLHIALPNSIRPANGPGTTTCLEMLPTIAGGRYRAAQTAAGTGDILDFTTAGGDISFDMFGQFSALPGQTPVAGDLVVVYNLGAATPGASAYAQNNTAAIAKVVYPDPTPGAPAGETQITFTNATLFPLASPNNRFQVIGAVAAGPNSAPVSYVCTSGPPDALGNGTGTLTRVFGYGMTPVQSCPPAGGTTTLLANNLTTCAISYLPAGGNNTTAREGLVTVQLGLTQNNETVNIYNEVHVNNAP
jgi:MSHA biogenesis protein MshO